MDILENDGVKFIAGLLTVLAAVNWPLIEFANYNVLTDLLKLSESSGLYQVVLGLIAVAAAIELYAVVYYNLDLDGGM